MKNHCKVPIVKRQLSYKVEVTFVWFLVENLSLNGVWFDALRNSVDIPLLMTYVNGRLVDFFTENGQKVYDGKCFCEGPLQHKNRFRDDTTVSFNNFAIYERSVSGYPPTVSELKCKLQIRIS